MEVEAGYKQSDIGVIPQDWRVDHIASFWNVTDCKHVTAKFIANGFPVASIKEVQSRFVDLTDAKQTTMHFYNLLIEGGRKPRDGDLILSRNATVGEVARVTDWHPLFAMGQDVCLLRKKSLDFSTDFLQSVFRSSIIGNQLADLMVGSTFKRVNVQQIKSLVVPMPPPAEQQAIAETLCDADTFIECLEQLLAKKRQLKKGAMQELLTGKMRLPGFTGDWEVGTLQEITDCFDNLRVPLNEGQREKMRGEYPYCGANGVLDFVNSYVVDDDVMLIAEDGGYFDEYADRPIAYRMIGKCWVNNHAHILKAKRGFDQGFIFYSLVHKNILSFLASGTRAKLNKTEMNKIEVRLPSREAEQTAIATILSDMDSEIDTLVAYVEKCRLLKQGMMQQLLTGKGRLK